MEQDTIIKLSYDDLVAYTDGFSEENYIGDFQFGQLYRGKMKQDAIRTRDVTVKVWEKSACKNDDEKRLRNEVFFLQHEVMSSHPNLVKLIGYWCESTQWPGAVYDVGVVYDIKPLDTLNHLLLKDSFTWPQRIKVALGFARLLVSLLSNSSRYLPVLVRNIPAAHIILDEDYNPKLYDFSMISGGVLPDCCYVNHWHICDDFRYYADLETETKVREEPEVLYFGVLLLCLIAKKTYLDKDDPLHDDDATTVDEWAWDAYKQKKSLLGFNRSNCSLVHSSHEKSCYFYPSDGIKITRLAMQCVEECPSDRPPMKQVLKQLLDLRVVRSHAGILGINKTVPKQHRFPLYNLLSILMNLKLRLRDFYVKYFHK